MANASYAQSSFLGGAVAETVQGQFDHPSYRTWMKVCLNSMPMEQKAWTRRPGSRNLRTTRGGLPGRVISFDFKQSSPYSMELTAGFLRFRSGPTLVTSNIVQTVTAISAANPAKVTTGTHGWAPGNQVMFADLGANNPLLQNRVFAITVTSATEFTIVDSITGATIDGATLGTFVSGTVKRIKEFVTPYAGDLWQTVRSIQADIPTTNSTTPGAVFLHAAVMPYVLQVTSPPTASSSAVFTLSAANFKDGPYFDPVPGGTLATPGALIGNVSLTLSFNAYDAARSYAIGDYVANGGVNYKSLVDANLGSAPPSANWVAVSAADAIGPNGFQGSDVGRMVRLFSEPPLWAVGSIYSAGTSIVAYAGTYWKCLTGNTAASTNTPSTAPTIWALFPAGAIWTWGKIVSLTNIIDRALAGSANIGDMTLGGGLAAAFDGVLSQASAASAAQSVSSATFVAPGGTFPSFSTYVGKNYAGATDQIIAQAIVYPSNDTGLAYGTFTQGFGTSAFVFDGGANGAITLNLRGKATLPANAADGTLLGTSGAIANTTSPVTIISTDQTTAWKYVWVEEIVTGARNYSAAFATAYSIVNNVAELVFVSPAGTGSSAGVAVQIIGDALLYTSAVRIWRLGLYSNTTGWPTCGTYHEGRLWLSGAVANRIDSSKSNDIFNFAPTNPDGTVAGNNGISYTFNAPDVNPIFWMEPDGTGIVCGTQAGEWLVRATTQNLPLTPTTIQAHRVTKYNCANILPAKTNLTLAIVQAFKRELLEYFADVYSSRFSAHDLALYAKHLLASGIQEVCYQQELIPTIWARCGDGSFIGCTYSRQSLVSSQPPEAFGWHPHELGSERTVESICIGANSDGTLDALVMVTNDAATGIRHVEMLTNVFQETDAPAAAWMLDNAVVPSSTSTTNTPSVGAPYGGLTVNGLWHLNGETVQVFAAGLDCGQQEFGEDIVDFVVSNGSIFIPYGDSISAGTGGGLFTAEFAVEALAAGQVVVGFTYTSDGQIVRPNSPAETGARNGPGFGKLRRNHQYAILVNQTAGLSIGTDFAKLDEVKFNAPGSDTAMAINATFSGIYRDTIQDDNSYDGAICWRVTRPLPATIAAIGGFIETVDA